MTQDRTARATPHRFALSPVIALLALAVLLVGVFAIHSEATGHAMPGSASVTAAHQSMADDGAASVGSMVASFAAPGIATLGSTFPQGMLDCTLFAMTCVLLLTLVVSVSLTRSPASYARLRDAGGSVLDVIAHTITLPIHRPRLTLLGIRRV